MVTQSWWRSSVRTRAAADGTEKQEKDSYLRLSLLVFNMKTL